MGIFNRGNNKNQEEELSMLIIKENGEVKTEGNFNRNKLISLLRKELQYQKKMEEIQIKKQVKKDLKEQN